MTTDEEVRVREWNKRAFPAKLTDDEIQRLWSLSRTPLEFARAIEKAVREEYESRIKP